MVSRAASKCRLYDQLLALPENQTGEILNGQLHTQPRPAGPHGRAESALESDLFQKFDRGHGGPGGWWILIEPEIHFIRDIEVTVPDIAGWQRKRMPEIPRDHRFEVIPDWICEIVSPSTESKDRQIKMPLYAHYGVNHLWLVDPIKKTLEGYQCNGGEWTIIGSYRGQEEARVAPFDAVSIELKDLWC